MKPRHFLDIDAFPRQTLRAILDEAHAMKALGRNSLPDKVEIRPRRRARHDLRAALDADAGVVRSRHARAWRNLDHVEPGRHADRQRRDHRRHRPRAVALCRRHHDQDRLAREAARACRACHGAGDQRAHQPLPSLPGHGRCHDLRGEEGLDRGQDRRLARRCQQRRHLLGACRGPLRLQAEARLPEAIQAGAGASRLGQGRGRLRRGPATIRLPRPRAPIAW